MNKQSLLKEIKNILSNYHNEDLSQEEKGLREILTNKDKMLMTIIGGYKKSNLFIKDGIVYLDLEFTKNNKARVTVMNYNLNEETNEYTYTYYIRKLSDNENSLGYYTYDQKNRTIKYDVCSRENEGISTFKGYVEKDNTNKDHTIGVSKTFSYDSLENNIPFYDFRKLPISVITNVIYSHNLTIEPSYEEYVEAIDGTIINAETNVNTDEHRLFRKGSTMYNASIEENKRK